MGQRSSSSFFRPRPCTWKLGEEQLRQHRRRCDFDGNTGYAYEGHEYFEGNITVDANAECTATRRNSTERKNRLRDNILRRAKYQEKKIANEEDRFVGVSSDKYARGIDKISMQKAKIEKAFSEPSLFTDGSSSARKMSGSIESEKHRRRRTRRSHKARTDSATSELLCENNSFRRTNTDLDAFLLEASIEKPANVPVVVSFPSILYQTRSGTQDEIALPLGTVVNAVFKNQSWLYVQTAHGQEGYIGYAACVPLGILPQSKRKGPCWEDPTDVFPQPRGNNADSEFLKDTTSEYGTNEGNVRSLTMETASQFKQEWSDLSLTSTDKRERNVDCLYLRTAANGQTSHTPCDALLISRSDLTACDYKSMSISNGNTVMLLADRVMNDWFWITTHDGKQGFVPTPMITAYGLL